MSESSPPDSEPPMLEDRWRGDGRSKMTAGQIAMGIAVWVASVSLGCSIGFESNSPSVGFFYFAVLLVPSSVYFSSRLGWRGFLPGVLIGMALTCLVPLGIVAVFCGIYGGKSINTKKRS